ncbi:MAG: NUDIX hydrolase [Woeseiaceae bacterium]|nr:NUDIX hydrolase [Woeseiaceae bacterium]
MTYCYDYPHPAVATDIVVFSVRDGTRHVLLIERAAEPFAGCWALPGGFVEIDEDLADAARRELYEETGLTCTTLEQLHAFGEPRRDPRERVISIAYVGMVEAGSGAPRAASDAAAARWFDLGALPPLAFDHAEMITLALARVTSTDAG